MTYFVDSLCHYGTPRHSGRYPWGSGENPYQHEDYFLKNVKEMRAKGLTDTEIAKGMGMSTSEFRSMVTVSKERKHAADVALAIRLKEDGLNNVAIGKQMGINESQVRSLLKSSEQKSKMTVDNISSVLKNRLKEVDYIDVGTGSESFLNVSRDQLKKSLDQLKKEGYFVDEVYIDQMGTDKKTTVLVLGKPDGSRRDAYLNMDEIKMIRDVRIADDSITSLGLKPPASISSKRIQVRYAEQGGVDKDGVIEIRRGVEDLSLGNSKYAQVRIAVDGTHYLKGMAVYSDDMPDGVDIIFNTNKHEGTPKMKVLKEMKKDPETGKVSLDNPFGATIKSGGQSYYISKDGKERLSAINKVNEEGDWDKWSKTLSSQMLSKQLPSLAEKQLKLAYSQKKSEYDEIMSLTNDAVKKRLLVALADDCDSTSVHLDAAGLPRQRYQVILPITGMKDTEIYAPNYKNGETVALVRYPHGGTFEIPVLTVNNNHKNAKAVMGNAKDAVGINSSVAERLSGADFDGDTVLVIPTSTAKIKSSPPLKELTNFDPKEQYKKYPGMKVISSSTKQKEMGVVSNLITDMTIKGASQDEIARAVKHSMVVIDAEKHELNYKQSYIDNQIAELQKKYQDKGGGRYGGASTLISKASSEVRVPDRKEGALVVDPKTGKTKRVFVDPETGKKLYQYTGENYITTKRLKDGTVKTETHIRTISSTRMAETDDAYSLSSGTRMENIYASYANSLKALANQARKDSISINKTVYSPSARKIYSKEVADLDARLKLVQQNKPLERQAQIIANTVYSAKLKANPSMDKEEKKKIKNQALAAARARVGSEKHVMTISDKEWEAIQAGAISYSKLNQILDCADLDRVKELATPKSKKSMSSSKLNRARALLAAGYTQSEVADAVGVSISTLRDNNLL